MLKPNAAKTLQSTEVSRIVAEFKAQGGLIVKVKPSVAGGLKKKKYLRKTA